MIPWGVAACPKSGASKKSAARTAIFVGRLYPVKGLPLLLNAWGQARPSAWQLRIVGPDQAGHRAELETLVRKLGLESSVEFCGPLNGQALREAYQSAELFILPSHSENFGMVIGEALAYGLPIITTHGTPWELLEQERCGWWVPVNVASIAAALDDATKRPADELAAMGARGQRVGSERFSWNKITRDFIACYEWILGRESKPACVME
jgi:glycosyltransferase involved in cell wall biosynthesis